MNSVIRVAVLVMLAGALSSCTSSAPASSPSQVPSPAPTPTPQPPTPPPQTETTYVMSGYVRSSLGGGTIANARLEILQGVNAGKTAWSDSGGLYRFEQLKTSAMQVRVSAADYDGQTVNVSITGNLTMNFELTPLMPYVYSGIVTDGIGRPVVGATVRGGPNSGVTDANGRYEFRSPYNSVPGNVYPPAGYERKPVHFYESFPMSAGVLNISIRRITSVTIAPPATLKVGEYASMSPRITFDTGQVELPHYDYFQRSVSDFTVLKFSGVVNAMVEAIKPGTASVTGSYFGAAANTAQIQVVP